MKICYEDDVVALLKYCNGPDAIFSNIGITIPLEKECVVVENILSIS